MNNRTMLKMAYMAAAPVGIGAAMGYRDAPDDAKMEGAFRGGATWGGTTAGIAAGGTLGNEIGKLAVNPGTSPAARALIRLLPMLTGATAGGIAGYGITNRLLGPASYDKKNPVMDDGSDMVGEEDTATY